ncbi:MAG: hypothetical protein N3F67_00795 [Acidilobaceae archaeon]|nr:hypothetical protein [Acidilobaceae archaeon]
MGAPARQGMYLVLLAYALLAAMLLVLALPLPRYSGIVVKDAEEILWLSAGPSFVARRGDEVLLVSERAMVVRFAGKPCSSEGRLYVFSGSELLVASPSQGRAFKYLLPLSLSAFDIHCSSYTVYLAGFSEGELKAIAIDVAAGKGSLASLEAPSTGETKVLGLEDSIYVALDRSLLELRGSLAFAYELIPNVRPLGIALYDGSPVVYGKRERAALIYWPREALAIEVEIPGRESRVDAMECWGYWCKALIVPLGDWMRVAEFKEWRYVKDMKLVGTRGFVYGRAGVSEDIWFAGRLVDVGPIAVSVDSTAKATLGSGEKGFFIVEDGTPRPRLYEYRAPPAVRLLEVKWEPLELKKEDVASRIEGLHYERIRPLGDPLRGVLTAIALLSPLAAYLIRRALR